MIPVEGKVLVKFSASWCQPCKALSAVMKTVDIDVPVVEIDIDNDVNTTREYGIRGVPTLILIENGDILDRISGSITKDKLVEFLK